MTEPEWMTEAKYREWKRNLRRGVRNLTIICVVTVLLTLGITCGPGDADMESAVSIRNTHQQGK